LKGVRNLAQRPVDLSKVEDLPMKEAYEIRKLLQESLTLQMLSEVKFLKIGEILARKGYTKNTDVTSDAMHFTDTKMIHKLEQEWQKEKTI